MVSIHFLVLNMPTNKDRLESIQTQLNILNCSYSVISAIDGRNMENDEDAKNILHPKENIIGMKFKCLETNTAWSYDGSISKSFPNLKLLGHYGTKGLTLSNIKALKIASKLAYDWYCILEDDAIIDEMSYDKILKFINNNTNNKFDIVLLDRRHNGWGGTAGMMYNKKIINRVAVDLHPLSKFSILSHTLGDKKLSNLWDWKLWKYVVHVNKNFTNLPCIDSGKFISTINI
jgi:hypothetical protein